MSFLRGTFRVRVLVWRGCSRSNGFFRLSSNCFCIAKPSLSRLQHSTMSQKKPFERLPSSVLPKNYKLSLKPNLTEFTFTGEEVIDVEVNAHLTILHFTINPIHEAPFRGMYFFYRRILPVGVENLNFQGVPHGDIPFFHPHPP